MKMIRYRPMSAARQHDWDRKLESLALRHARLALALIVCAASPALNPLWGQAVPLHPARISGNVQFNISNPTIRDILDAGGECMHYLYVRADGIGAGSGGTNSSPSVPPVVGPLSATYALDVSTTTAGLPFRVSATIYLHAGNQFFYTPTPVNTGTILPNTTTPGVNPELLT